jgi:hypothetical protein
MANKHIIRKDAAIIGGLLVNAEFSDADIVFNRNTTGIAYTYDAGLDIHIFSSPTLINSLGALIVPLTIKGAVDQSANWQEWVTEDDTVIASVGAAGLTLGAGASINLFDTDVLLAADSNSRIPTQKAIKSYVASYGAGAFVPLSRTVNGKQLNANISLIGSDIGVTTTNFSSLLLTSDDTIQKAFDRLDDHQHTVGMLRSDLVTNNGDGTVNIDSGDCYLYSASGWTGFLSKYTIPARTNVSLVNNSINYVYVNYNSGSPEYTTTTNPATLNNSDRVFVAGIWREGTILHILQANFATATSTRINDRLIQTQRFVRTSGLTLSESPTRHIDLSYGVVYYGCKNYTLDAVQSDVDVSWLYYHFSGEWVQSALTAYNNLQYDDGTDLQTVGSNKYVVNWVYRFIETPKHIAVILGSGDYDITQAKNSQPPTPPTILSIMAILVGRIIVKKSSDTATQIDSAFIQTFITQPATNHNDLGSIEGGIEGEYFHLTSQEYTDLHDTALIETGNFDIARMPVSGSWELTGDLNVIDDETVPNSILFIDKTNRRVGVTQPVPTNLLHLYGTNTVPDDLDNIFNMLQVDSVPDGDSGVSYALDGVQRFDHYMYRNEGGEYFYLWGHECQYDLQVVTAAGRYGWLQPTNWVNDHVAYTGGVSGSLNDMDAGGEYSSSMSYNTSFEVRIVTADTVDQFKFRRSYDAGVTWTSWSSSIDCDTDPIELENGVTVVFGAVTGHNTDDAWNFTAFSINPDASYSIHGMMFKEVLTTTDYTAATPEVEDVTYNACTTFANTFTGLPIGDGDTNKGAIYLGATHDFSSCLVISTVFAVNATLVFEYYKTGDGWTAITGANGLSDSTFNLTKSGQIIWNGSSLTDWNTYQIPGQPDEYDLYWIRIRSSTVMTTAPVFSAIMPHGGKRFAVYAGHLDHSPVFYISGGGRVFIKAPDGVGTTLNVENATVSGRNIRLNVDDDDTVSISMRQGGDNTSYETLFKYGGIDFNTTGIDAIISHKYNRAIKFYKDVSGDNDLIFQMELDGTLSTGIANYEDLVTSDNDIPNKKYVDEATSGGLQYQTTWNASTNTPDITGATVAGYFWVVTTAGSTNLGGITTWEVGDWVIKTSTGWSRLPAVSVTWGSITGTLSNQTDLQNALNDRVTDTELAAWTGSSNIATVGTITSGTWTGSRIGTTYLDTNVTAQGNTFNGTSQLVQTNSSGYLPALNASLLTNIGWSNISKTGSSLADLQTRSASDLTSGNLAIARMPSVGGNWVCSSQVYLQNSFRSTSYIMGTGPDMSLQPVVGGQSAIQAWWGLILKANQQTSVEAAPTAIGTSSRASVLIPCQQTASIGLDIIRITSQTGDILRIDDENLTKLFSIGASGALSFTTGASISLFDADGLMTANSDSRLSTQKAVVTYVGAFAGSTNITTLGTITTGSWNATAIAWNKVDKTGSSLADLATRHFTQLDDVPTSYTGNGLNVVRVNSGATALEFYDLKHVPTTVARVTGTVTSTSTSFADITGLTFSVAANTSYLLECEIIYQSTAAGTGIAFGVNGPATPTSVQIFTQIMTTATAQVVGNQNAYDTGTATASATANTNLRGRLVCILDNGNNSGTLAVRFASETGTAVSVRVGSVARLTQTT